MSWEQLYLRLILKELHALYKMWPLLLDII